MKVTKLLRSDDNQEAVRPRRRQHKAPEEHLILPVPHARLVALEYLTDHTVRIVGVESAGTVEPRVAGDLPVADDLPLRHDSGRIEVRRAREPVGIARVTLHPAAPHASESGHTHQHVTYPPLSLLFFSRSACNCC